MNAAIEENARREHDPLASPHLFVSRRLYQNKVRNTKSGKKTATTCRPGSVGSRRVISRTIPFFSGPRQQGVVAIVMVTSSR